MSDKTRVLVTLEYRVEVVIDRNLLLDYEGVMPDERESSSDTITVDASKVLLAVMQATDREQLHNVALLRSVHVEEVGE